MSFAKCQAEDRALRERVSISFGDEPLWRKYRFSGKLILRSFAKVKQMKAPECFETWANIHLIIRPDQGNPAFSV